jgi:hypothetical protein
MCRATTEYKDYSDNILEGTMKFICLEYIALQSIRNAATLRYQQGKVAITDGPYAETKEQLGGFLVQVSGHH